MPTKQNKLVARLVSFSIIVSFVFSNVSFAFTQDTLRTEGPTFTGAGATIAKELKAAAGAAADEKAVTANRLDPKKLNGLVLDDGSVVRVLSEKEDFPPEVLSHWDNHYAVFEITNEKLGYTAYMAIHYLTKIKSLAKAIDGQYRVTGGTRIRNYKDNNAALADALELALEMSFKNAGAKLPIGGSKCTINVKIDPRSNGENAEARKQILISYAKAIERIGNLIGGGVLTGQDINISEKDAKLFFRYAPTSIVPYIDEEHCIPPTPPTGIGVFAAMRAAVKEAFPDAPSLEGKVVAIQGVGGTGGLLLNPLLNAGAKVIASDVDTDKVEGLKQQYAEFIKKGQLFIFTEDRLPGGGYSSKILNPSDRLALPWRLDHVDVFSPCAVGPVLNPVTIETIKQAGVKVICGSANNVSEDKTRDPQLCKEAGILYIPDYIANAGGVTGVDGHLGHDISDEGITKRIYARVIELIKTARAEDKTPQETADRTSRAFFEKLPRAEKQKPFVLVSGPESISNIPELISWLDSSALKATKGHSLSQAIIYFILLRIDSSRSDYYDYYRKRITELYKKDHNQVTEAVFNAVFLQDSSADDIYKKRLLELAENSDYIPARAIAYAALFQNEPTNDLYKAKLLDLANKATEYLSKSIAYAALFQNDPANGEDYKRELLLLQGNAKQVAAKAVIYSTLLPSYKTAQAPGSPAGVYSLLLKTDPALYLTESYIAQNVGARELKVSTVRPDITALKQWGLVETLIPGGKNIRLTQTARDHEKQLLPILQSLPARPTKAQRDAIASQIAAILSSGKAAGNVQITAQPTLDADTVEKLKTLSSYVRRDILQMLFNAGSGHPGGSLSVAEILTTLYFSGILKNDPNDSEWVNRDRVVLSAGHKAPALYAVLGEAGYFSKKEFEELRKNPASMLQGHPDKKKTPGVDWSTGALGQGFSAACGMAAAARLQGKTSHIWSVIGGGERQEGQIFEAAEHAAKLGLTNLTAIIDDNGYQIEGSEAEVTVADVPGVFRKLGWNVVVVDGHDPAQLYTAMAAAKKGGTGKPTCIVAKTQKGKGVKYFEDRPAESHGSVPKDEAVRAEALREVNAAIVASAPFNGIDGFIRAKQLSAGEKSRIDEINYQPKPAAEKKTVTLKELKPDGKIATRVAFGEMMNHLGSTHPNLMAMSADLQPSANLVEFEKLYGLMSEENPQGRYVALGIREQHGPSFAAGMASMGIIPVVHTFDIFSLNMLPQLRVIIQMGIPVVLACTHSGVGTGEDGVTHQGVESPGVMDILSGPLGDMMDVYEPADAGEVRVILTSLFKDGLAPKKPVFLRMTRQDVSVLDKSGVENYEQKVADGSYVLRDPGKGKNDLIITATGATVAEAVKVSEELEKKIGIKVKVINVVSLNKIDNPGNPFSSYLEDNVPIITVCDALAKVLQNPVLRAADLIRKQGRNPGSVYPLGVTILGSGTPQLLYTLNGLDAAGIKKSALDVLVRDSHRLAPSPLLKFQKIGQEIWVDGLTYDMIEDGGMFEELVRNHGISGVTTNPTLINAYLKDEKVLAKAQELARRGFSQQEVYFELVKDLALRVKNVFDKCGKKGKFSVELDPTKATDVEASVKEAMKWTDIDPEFMMVKVCLTPGSNAGYKIIEEVTARGRNVNATVIMSPEQYSRVVEAYLTGLERADEAGLDLSKIFSVASFFISRWDVKLADKMSKMPPEYIGMLANSVAIWAYNRIFLDVFNSPRFKALEAKGARKQLFLLASTGSKADKMPEPIRGKFPHYVYATPVQGEWVVNTMPAEPTLYYLITHGDLIKEEETIKANLPQAEEIMAYFERNGIYTENVGMQLLSEGMDSFVKEFLDIQQTLAKIVEANKPVTAPAPAPGDNPNTDELDENLKKAPLFLAKGQSTEACNLLTEAIEEYSQLLTNYPPDSEMHINLSGKLSHAVQLWAQAAPEVLRKQDVGKWAEEDFAVLQYIIDNRELHNPVVRNGIGRLFYKLVDYIWDLNPRKLNRLIERREQKYQNVLLSFKTITSVVRNPQLNPAANRMVVDMPLLRPPLDSPNENITFEQLRERIALYIAPPEFLPSFEQLNKPLYEAIRLAETLLEEVRTGKLATAPAPEDLLKEYQDDIQRLTSEIKGLIDGSYQVSSERFRNEFSSRANALAKIAVSAEKQNAPHISQQAQIALRDIVTGLETRFTPVDRRLAEIASTTAKTALDNMYRELRAMRLESIVTRSAKVDADKVKAAVDELIGPEAKPEASARLFSTKSIFEEGGLGLILPALAKTGEERIAVIVEEKDEKARNAQIEVINRLNLNLDVDKQIQFYSSAEEAVSYLTTKQGIEKITYVSSYQEALDIKEAKPSWYNPDIIRLDVVSQKIIRAVGEIKGLTGELEMFRHTCELLGTRV